MDVKLGQTEQGKPGRPKARIAAAKRHEDQTSGLLVRSPIQNGVIILLQNGREPAEKLDVINALDENQRRTFAGGDLGLRKGSDGTYSGRKTASNAGRPPDHEGRKPRTRIGEATQTASPDSSRSPM